MSDDPDSKTLAPSQKKLDDAAKRGEVASAPEVRHALSLLAMLGALLWLGNHAVRVLATTLRHFWEGAADLRIDPVGGTHFATGVMAQMAALVGPFLLLFFLAAILTGLIQSKPSLSWARLAPKWSKINPAAGLKRMFGPQGLVEFAKLLAKSLAVVGLGWWLLSPRLPGADSLVGLEPAAIGAAAAALAISLIKTLLMLVAALAALDFGWQRFSFLRKMRMSHQEMRDEHKDSDGNPQVKAKQRQIGAQRARQRMMAAVPTASVVITNPTHYAVALKYEHGSMRAPVVVAKGTDRTALKIRELATEAGVPLVENRPLARALHAHARIDHPIPVEQYAAVAEVISFVLRQTGKLRG